MNLLSYEVEREFAEIYGFIESYQWQREAYERYITMESAENQMSAIQMKILFRFRRGISESIKGMMEKRGQFSYVKEWDEITKTIWPIMDELLEKELD